MNSPYTMDDVYGNRSPGRGLTVQRGGAKRGNTKDPYAGPSAQPAREPVPSPAVAQVAAQEAASARMAEQMAAQSAAQKSVPDQSGVPINQVYASIASEVHPAAQAFMPGRSNGSPIYARPQISQGPGSMSGIVGGARIGTSRISGMLAAVPQAAPLAGHVNPYLAPSGQVESPSNSYAPILILGAIILAGGAYIYSQKDERETHEEYLRRTGRRSSR